MKMTPKLTIGLAIVAILSGIFTTAEGVAEIVKVKAEGNNDQPLLEEKEEEE